MMNVALNNFVEQMRATQAQNPSQTHMVHLFPSKTDLIDKQHI
jgi:hypothetical protein